LLTFLKKSDIIQIFIENKGRIIMKETVLHTLPPIYQTDSRVLILGTIPSPKSRESGFYYGHPQNRFWRVLAALYQESLPQTNREKEAFLLRHRIALWDVLASCKIDGASDSSIADPEPNDIGWLLGQTEISAVFCTGAKSAELYQKHCYPKTGLAAIKLPSTSPANCRLSLDTLCREYRCLLEYTER